MRGRFLPIVLICAALSANACGPSSTRSVSPTDAPVPLVHVRQAVEYDVQHTVTLVNNGPGIAVRVRLWVAMIRDAMPYQEARSLDVTPREYEIVTDEHGNLFALFTFDDVEPGGSVAAELHYRVTVNELSYDLGDCTGSLPGVFVDPEPYIESDAERITALAEKLSEGKTTACGKVRAFYDYVADAVSYATYDPAEKGALLTLESLSGDCTDFADSMIALSRAAGIPARLIAGVTCCTDEGYVEADVKHDWVEVYLPSVGWVPMDPARGRFPENREMYFAGMMPDHIVVVQGQNLPVLEGYHYYHFSYEWDEESTAVSAQDEWAIVGLAE